MLLSRLVDLNSHHQLAGFVVHGYGLTTCSRRYGFVPEVSDQPLTLSWQEALLETGQETPSSPQSKITMVHGFYAAMGGFVVRSHDAGKVYTITGRKRLTLHSESVIWLLRMAPGLFPDLSEDEILDKSKASTLVKALTCLQALWFCLQCIVRLTMNTSISLLELNVFGHCVCTFIIYALWWNKPMEISEPTLLSLEGRPEFRSLIALLGSHPDGKAPRLPPPLDECFFSGHEYHGETKYQSGTRSYTTGSPSRDIEYDYTPNFCGPKVYDDETQTDECAGLRIEQLLQLLDLDESDSHM
jgi:hypothetical protein